jgi:hypothetical protein
LIASNFFISLNSGLSQRCSIFHDCSIWSSTIHCTMEAFWKLFAVQDLFSPGLHLNVTKYDSRGFSEVRAWKLSSLRNHHFWRNSHHFGKTADQKICIALVRIPWIVFWSVLSGTSKTTRIPHISRISFGSVYSLLHNIFQIILITDLSLTFIIPE